MIALLRWFFSLLVALAAVLFALGNRTSAEFLFSPFHNALTLPLFVPVLAGVAVGFMLGGALVWLNGAEGRAARRRQRRQIAQLEDRLREAEKNTELLPDEP